MSKGFDGQAESTSKPKVSNFQIPGFINQKILRLEVAVDDTTSVTVVDSIDQLIDQKLDGVGSDGGLVFVQVFLQVVVEQFKNQI